MRRGGKMKQVLTLEEIDDYVEAIIAFLPTPAQRQFKNVNMQ